MDLPFCMAQKLKKWSRHRLKKLIVSLIKFWLLNQLLSYQFQGFCLLRKKDTYPKFQYLYLLVALKNE